jgi:uracil-DNA glycosylase
MREKTQLNLELSPKINSLQELAKAENECTRCPLYKDATQAVPGEGRKSAHLMLVGEQPGDKEDLSGKPFVGPAGGVLDRALAEAGIARSEVFVTNAVKHFKHEMRGKRRLHKRPNAYEIERCKIWLDRERAIVKPVAIVALGATAARSLLGRSVTIGKLRGQTLHLADGTAVFVTIHPSWLLRMEDDADKQREYDNFVADLRPAARVLRKQGGLSRRRVEQPYSCSVNRPLTSAASASTTSAACGPLASTVIVVPGPAASIIRPMIEVPPTTSWPRLTFTSQSNLSTVCTNFAEARACNPFLLQISSTRMIGAGFGG